MGGFNTLPISSLPANSGSTLSGITLNSPGSSSSPLTTGLADAMLGGATAGLLNQPTNTSGTSSSSTSSSGSSSTQKTLTPYQTALQGPLYEYLINLITNPSQTVAPFLNQARNQVNDNYTGLADSLRQQFLSTGGGTSGKYGLALGSANNQRIGQLSNADSTFANTAATLPLQASSLATNLLGLNFGSTSSTGSNSSSSGNTQQTQSSGNPVLTGIAGLLSSLAAL